MADEIRFSKARELGSNFPLGSVKNIYDCGPYGFIEYYVKGAGTETKVQAFKADRVFGIPRDNLPEAMFHISSYEMARVEEERKQVTGRTTVPYTMAPVLPFSKTIVC